MPNYAIIQAGVVANVIDADAAFIAENFPGAAVLLEAGQRAGVGWSYDGTKFVPPAAPAPAATTGSAFQDVSALFTQKDFMDLFNQPNELKTCLAWESSTTLTDDQKNNLREFFYYFDHTPLIDMTMATTIGGLQMLEAYGLLAAGRAAQIASARH